MAQKLLLGDEAVAQAALDAGIVGCYAYPGTPSTEIMEYIQGSAEARERRVHSQWSTNEKSAMEEALGVSYCGRRALVCMKHVGLNVASDGFVNSAITGTEGGLVVTVADDPSMHSSQNEQDSRFYAQFALVPCFEPSNQQEAYDMVGVAMDMSEELKVPVMLRIVTRMAHSRANIATGATRPAAPVRIPQDLSRFVLLPVNARKGYARLVEKQPEFLKRAEDSRFNRLIAGPDRSLGIIAAGIGFNYLMETFGGEPCPHPVLKVSQYPLPRKQLLQLFDQCRKVLVIEDGAPFIEGMLHGPMGPSDRVLGRLTGQLPRMGELTPDVVAKALGKEVKAGPPTSSLLRPRPPRLCDGCPHASSYEAILEAVKEAGPGHVFSDIGCYTLGALPPYNAINSCVDMGASISMAKGAADAGLRPAIAVIGDSTFTHSGMTPLLDAVLENSPITVIVLDNGTTGMTGGQVSAATGRLENIAAGLGVPKEHIRVFEALPKNHAQNVQALKEEIVHEGVSFVIARRECIQTARKAK